MYRILLFICIMLTSCQSGKVNYYLLDQNNLDNTYINNNEDILFHWKGVLQPFDSDFFMIKLGPYKYTIDYYNRFIANPNKQLEQYFSFIFGKTKNLNFHQPRTKKYSITILIKKMYIDISSNKNNYHFEANVVFNNMKSKNIKEIFKKDYYIIVPIDNLDGKSVMATLTKCINKFIKSINNDLLKLIK